MLPHVPSWLRAITEDLKHLLSLNEYPKTPQEEKGGSSVILINQKDIKRSDII
jgi:hypothetical protein